MIDPNEVEAIASVIEARLHEAEGKEKQICRHWPRRVGLSVAVMVLAIFTHWLIAREGAEHLLQSAELGLAAPFDSLFTKAREV